MTIDLIARLNNPGPQPPSPADILQERKQRAERFSKTHKELAKNYVAGEALCSAVDVALSLGRPLLLTGEPGSGKTLAASWIAHLLGLPDSHFQQFHVHSDSRARDLRYEFNAVGWFRASQIASKEVDKAPYITPRALGLAFGWPEKSDTANPYLVLIDEIDKAPRDFPNDLLLELDQMKFEIEETRQTVGPPAQRPIIVITSNAERRLPDPFLRRCIVHNIELTAETVSRILAQRLGEVSPADDALVKAATAFWTGVKKVPLTRSPTVAEFWQWLALVGLHGGLTPGGLTAALGKGPAEAGNLPFVASLLSAADLKVLAGSA